MLILKNFGGPKRMKSSTINFGDLFSPCLTNFFQHFLQNKSLVPWKRVIFFVKKMREKTLSSWTTIGAGPGDRILRSKGCTASLSPPWAGLPQVKTEPSSPQELKRQKATPPGCLVGLVNLGFVLFGFVLVFKLPPTQKKIQQPPPRTIWITTIHLKISSHLPTSHKPSCKSPQRPHASPPRAAPAAAGLPKTPALYQVGGPRWPQVPEIQGFLIPSLKLT